MKEWRKEVYQEWKGQTFEWRSPGIICPEDFYNQLMEDGDEEKMCALEQTWAQWQGLTD